MNNALSIWAAHWVKPYYRFGHLLIVETISKEHEAVTDLITRLALRGPFHLIAGDEWLPDRDTLYRSVRRFTIEVDEILNHPILMRPMTCLQLLDLLTEVDMQNNPTLILDFLHHFYNADVELSLRDRVLEHCCQFTKRLSLSNSVVILVPRLSTDEYKRFFPLLAAIADEIIDARKNLAVKNFQTSLF